MNNRFLAIFLFILKLGLCDATQPEMAILLSFRFSTVQTFVTFYWSGLWEVARLIKGLQMHFLSMLPSPLKQTVKPVWTDHSKIDKTKVLMTNGSLMKVERIVECSPWSILQYFWPALSDNRSLKPILVFFFCGRLRQVLLYIPFSYFAGWFIFWCSVHHTISTDHT